MHGTIFPELSFFYFFLLITGCNAFLYVLIRILSTRTLYTNLTTVLWIAILFSWLFLPIPMDYLKLPLGKYGHLWLLCLPSIILFSSLVYPYLREQEKREHEEEERRIIERVGSLIHSFRFDSHRNQAVVVFEDSVIARCCLNLHRFLLAVGGGELRPLTDFVFTLSRLNGEHQLIVTSPVADLSNPRLGYREGEREVYLSLIPQQA